MRAAFRTIAIILALAFGTPVVTGFMLAVSGETMTRTDIAARDHIVGGACMIPQTGMFNPCAVLDTSMITDARCYDDTAGMVTVDWQDPCHTPAGQAPGSDISFAGN